MNLPIRPQEQSYICFSLNSQGTACPAPEGSVPHAALEGIKRLGSFILNIEVGLRGLAVIL